MNEVHVVTDLQFGSCGKGLFAGYLAEKLQPDTIVTAWGPNSGHTFIDRQGNKYVNIMLPNGIVATPRLRQVLIGPGSIINPAIMWEEYQRYRKFMEPVQFAIHESAAIVTQLHRDQEAKYGFGIGSTMKGVGEAVMDKIRRGAGYSGLTDAKHQLEGHPLRQFVVSKSIYDDMLDHADKVLIEGAQGYSLGINSGFYPYCTSRECTTWQLLSDCAIPANSGRLKVYGVCRSYPIRVANRFKWELSAAGRDMGGCAHAATAEKEGVMVCMNCGSQCNQVGTSGPCYSDQKEIEWKDIGREPELTTVTKLPRRLFTFSQEQVRQAIRANGVGSVFYNFANYHRADGMLEHRMSEIRAAGAPVKWLGWGPSIEDIQEV